jgi:hypothetical protein
VHAEKEVGEPGKGKERLLDTLVDLRGGLHKLDAELGRKLAALLLRDSPLVGPVAFIADEDLVHTLRCVLLDVRVPRADICEEVKSQNVKESFHVDV